MTKDILDNQMLSWDSERFHEEHPWQGDLYPIAERLLRLLRAGKNADVGQISMYEIMAIDLPRDRRDFSNVGAMYLAR